MQVNSWCTQLQLYDSTRNDHEVPHAMYAIVCVMHEVHLDLVLSLWQCSILYVYSQRSIY